MSRAAPKPLITYPALVGKVIAHTREQLGVKQGEFAQRLGSSQSAYSKLESGDSVFNLTQLHRICEKLGIQPSALLKRADEYEKQLRKSGVEIVSSKEDNTAAILIGIAFLGALLLGR